MSGPSPGWYPDPSGSSRVRWWDGQQWTNGYGESLPPADGTTVPQPAGNTRQPSGRRWLLPVAIGAGLVLLVGAIGLAAIVFAVRASNGGTGNGTAGSVQSADSPGARVVLRPQPVAQGGPITQDQLNNAMAIISKRLEGLGASGTSVTSQTQEEGTLIVVSASGIDTDQLVNLVQRTGLLEFRPVWGEYAPGVDDPSAAGKGQLAPPVQSPDNTEAFQQQVAGLDCVEPSHHVGDSTDDPALWLGTCERTGAAKFSLQPAFILGTSIMRTDAAPVSGESSWVITVQFDAAGTQALAETSASLVNLPDCGPDTANPCNAFAIVLDGIVMSAPRFTEPVTGDQAQIEGNFSEQEAKDLASILQYGALPVTFDVVEVTTTP